MFVLVAIFTLSISLHSLTLPHIPSCCRQAALRMLQASAPRRVSNAGQRIQKACAR